MRNQEKRKFSGLSEFILSMFGKKADIHHHFKRALWYHYLMLGFFCVFTQETLFLAYSEKNPYLIHATLITFSSQYKWLQNLFPLNMSL